MTKRKIFCPFYFYKMGRWRLRKANRHGSVVLAFFFITFYNKSGVMGNFATEPV
ncbi:hypothetical protein K8A75_15255 [Listeria monocytogenes]|nr:hypothetical protein [Listeria monocytogenes]